jgi:hypothetical protein
MMAPPPARVAKAGMLPVPDAPSPIAGLLFGYIGTGADGNGYKNDFWEYDPAANT